MCTGICVECSWRQLGMKRDSVVVESRRWVKKERMEREEAGGESLCNSNRAVPASSQLIAGVSLRDL